MMTMVLHQLILLFSFLMFAVTVTHVASHNVKGDSDDSVPVAQINVQVSLGGNNTSNVLASRKTLVIKGEKGERGKAGPRGRPAAENKCSCKDEMEEKLTSLTLIVKQLQRIQKGIYRSCQEAKHFASGVYTVDLDDGLGAFQVYCDMVTDGGGWTVFQRRQDGTVDFYRGWSDYKNGFGDLNGEFWLGLDKIHRLTKQQQLLRIDLIDFSNNRVYAKYEGFEVGDENSDYTMTFTSYSGNAGDGLTYHKGRKFSTKDMNNDGHNCAVSQRGAWWYNACFHSNLNAQYSRTSSSKPTSIVWQYWQKSNFPLKFTEMKIR